MATKWQKETKAALLGGLGADKVTCHRDGSLSAKRGYFYRHGCTATKWAAKVIAILDNAGCDAELIEARDDYKTWPQDSYFVARVKRSSLTKVLKEYMRNESKGENVTAEEIAAKFEVSIDAAVGAMDAAVESSHALIWTWNRSAICWSDCSVCAFRGPACDWCDAEDCDQGTSSVILGGYDKETG